jgi:hypothetical protein
VFISPTRLFIRHENLPYNFKFTPIPPRFPRLSVSDISPHKSHAREININGKAQLGEIAKGRTSLVRKRNNRSDRRNGDARSGIAGIGIAGVVAVAGTLVRSTLGTLRTADPVAPAEGTPDTQMAVVAGTLRTVALMGTPVVVDMEIHTLHYMLHRFQPI